MMEQDIQLTSNSNKTTPRYISPLTLWRELQQFDQVIMLIIVIVEAIQFFRKQETKILMSPGNIAEIWRHTIQILLQLLIVFFGAICRHFFKKFNALDELVTMLARFVYGLFNAEFFRILGGTSSPFASFFSAKKAKIELATTRNAAKSH